MAEKHSEKALESVRLSRRSLLITSAWLGLAITLGGKSAAYASSASLVSAGKQLNAWVHVADDDTITLVSPASEMGQGVKTSIPLIIAEEMDADWSKVHILHAPSDPKSFGNPGLGGEQATGASLATRAYFQPMRLIGAQARIAILAAAAELLKAPLTELITASSVVVHPSSGRSISFGEVARLGSFPEQIRSAVESDLKDPSQWRYLGKSTPRVDIPAKVTGSAEFGIDVQLPHMLYGVIARPQVQGETVLSYDDGEARLHKG